MKPNNGRPLRPLSSSELFVLEVNEEAALSAALTSVLGADIKQRAEQKEPPTARFRVKAFANGVSQGGSHLSEQGLEQMPMFGDYSSDISQSAMFADVAVGARIGAVGKGITALLEASDIKPDIQQTAFPDVEQRKCSASTEKNAQEGPCTSA